MRIFVFLCLSACLVGFSGCSALGISSGTCPASGGASLGEAPFLHVVIFKLKANAPEGEAQALIDDARELLAKVPSVKEVRAGRRAPVERSFNITDYDVGLVVKFPDKAGLEAYIEHPLHKEYVKKHKDYWETVRVIDFIAE